MVTLPGSLREPNFKPLWREPDPAKKIKFWPPKGYAEAYEVGTGNFWSVGRKFGRDNPWDIIIYNFQTETPREVNWYLHHAVGCWMSHDNDNFAFDLAVTKDFSPGKLYIPHAGWAPDPSFQKGSSAGKFIHGIQTNLVSILNQLSRRVPTIAYGNSRMPSSGYEKVAELINTGQIDVVIDPKFGNSARYVFDEKTIYLGDTPRLGDPFMAGVIANEATHAYTHWRNVEVNAYTNELISSLAESLASASVSVSWCRRQMDKTAHGYEKLYFPGWVWATELRGTSFIGETELDQPFSHPVLGYDENPWTQIIRYHDDIPQYRLKRSITWTWTW